MKRAGELFPLICEPDNLRLAYLKALRGKKERRDAREFGARLDRNLAELRERLLAGAAPVGEYRYFTIRDPKERTICAAAFRERVLHHAIMNVCDPVFERYQIDHSYATRRGKGTFAALEQAERWTRRGEWFLKLDVRKHFDHIDHAILMTQLARLFKDSELLALFERIIDSYRAAPGRGLPIGNLTSQYFANHYLAVADHYIKEGLGARRYLRYMDDMLLWAPDRSTLIERRGAIEVFMAERLRLTLKPPCLNRTEEGAPFLGFRLFPHRTTLRAGSRRRFRRKYAALRESFDAGEIEAAEFGARAETLIAHIRHAQCENFCRSVVAR